MPVAKHEVHPGIHAKENLAQNIEVMHMMAVDRHVADSSRHDMEAADVFLKLNPDHDTALGFNAFRRNQRARGLKLSLGNHSCDRVDFSLEESARHCRKNHFGVRTLFDALSTVLQKRGPKLRRLVVPEDHHRPEWQRNGHHALA